MITPVDNPGPRLNPLFLDRPVISCKAAAKAKGIDLEHELKSLLLITSHGAVLAHVRGNRRLSLRAVKVILDVNQAQLASPAELQDAGVGPGRVHPFVPSLWQLPQLIEQHVLQLDWVTTNAGDLNSYVVFDPKLLLSAPVASVEDLER